MRHRMDFDPRTGHTQVICFVLRSEFLEQNVPVLALT